MSTYKFVTPLVAFDGFTSSGEFKFVPSEQLKMLDRLEYNDEDFVNYMEPPLATVVRHASGIALQLDTGNGQLSAVTYFETDRELTDQELAQLKDYYDGQMADGIGENLLSEIQNRADVEFRLEVFGLYDDKMGSHLESVT